MGETNSGRGPDFICIGLQKAGTRWLYLQLKQHPDFWMPPIKELHFFDRVAAGKKFPTPRNISALAKARLDRAEDRAFASLVRSLGRQAAPGLDVYASLFDPAGSLMTGDITPAYGALPPQQIEQIARRFPRLKILLMLRDPISRLWSNVNDAANKDAIPSDYLLSADGMQKALALPIFASGSYPARTYRKWRSFFPEDQMKTFHLEDVVSAPEATRADVLTFLSATTTGGASEDSLSHNSKAGRPRQTMTDGVQAFLVASFEEELRDCARLFGGRAEQWLTKYGLA